MIEARTAAAIVGAAVAGGFQSNQFSEQLRGQWSGLRRRRRRWGFARLGIQEFEQRGDHQTFNIDRFLKVS